METNRPKRNHRSVSRSKWADDFQALTYQILEYSNQGISRTIYQQEISKMIMNFSGCEGVELWLKDHGKYFRGELKRRPGKKIFFKIKPHLQNEKGGILPSLDEEPGLLSLSNQMIRHSIDSLRTLHIKNGSKGIWGNGEYKSLVILPLRVDRQTIGLLLLKSIRPNYFKKDDIRLYEDFSRTLGIALAHRHVQVDLRERVKELTCLYGIARLATQSNLSMGEILQGIVELLPPAWLYTDIACAKITLDGASFSTPHFREGRYQQKADIIIGGDRRGSVEVVYPEDKPELDEGPFLQEERALLDTVAKEIANIIIGKQAEQDKLNLEEQLRHADRLATIGQLAAGVAHELNEPLGSILGFSQLVKKWTGLPHQVNQDIEKILNASLYAREIVKKLLIFARQMPYRKIKVNLNQLVEEGLHFFKSRCAKEGIELVCSLSADLPEIDADPSQLNQVVINLTVNALQAMPRGGRLKVQTLFRDNQVSLIIEDTGMGMSEEVLRKIFTPFFTTKEVGKGTGLGLPVVHGIITSHGGFINVESKVGQGTKFEIQFPTTRPSVNESESE